LSISSPDSFALAKQMRITFAFSLRSHTASSVFAFDSRHVKNSLTSAEPVAFQRSAQRFSNTPR
jgi:hypothetical protein